MAGNWSRRALLLTLGATGVAGCTGGNRSRTGTPTSTPTPTPTGRDATEPTPTDEAVQTKPTAKAKGTPGPRPGMRLESRVEHSFTDEHPARLRLELATEIDERVVVRYNVSDGQGGPFQGVWGTHRRSDAELGLFLHDGWQARCLPGDTAPPIPDAPVDGCWRPPCDEIDLPSSHGRFEIGPDDPKSGKYVLLDGFNDSCLPAGTYAFDGSRGNVSATVARARITESEVAAESPWYPLERRLTVSIDDAGDVAASAEAIVGSRDSSGDDDGSTPGSTPVPVERSG